MSKPRHLEAAAQGDWNAKLILRWLVDYVGTAGATGAFSGALCPVVTHRLQAGSVWYVRPEREPAPVMFWKEMRRLEVWFVKELERDPYTGLIISYPGASTSTKRRLLEWRAGSHERLAPVRSVGAAFWSAPPPQRTDQWPLSFKCPIPIAVIRRIKQAPTNRASSS